MRVGRLTGGRCRLRTVLPDPSIPTRATGAGGELLKQFVDSPNVEPTDPQFDAGWAADGGHVELSSYGALVADMHASDQISDSELQDIEQEVRQVAADGGTIGDQVGAYKEFLSAPGRGVTPLEGMGHDYSSRLGNYVVSGDGSELEDLVDHGTLPGPG